MGGRDKDRTLRQWSHTGVRDAGSKCGGERESSKQYGPSDRLGPSAIEYKRETRDFPFLMTPLACLFLAARYLRKPRKWLSLVSETSGAFLRGFF